MIYLDGKGLPRRDVRREPDTAESIFWTADMSVSTISTSDSLGSSIVTGLCSAGVSCIL